MSGYGSIYMYLLWSHMVFLSVFSPMRIDCTHWCSGADTEGWGVRGLQNTHTHTHTHTHHSDFITFL